MDIFNWVMMTASAVFGAGGVWGVLQYKVKQNTADIEKVDRKLEEHKSDVGDKLDRLDTKLDNIYLHLINRKQ